MKKQLTHIMACLLAILLIVGSLPCGSAFAANDDGRELTIKGKAGVIYCATTGEVVWQKNADVPMNLASITKLMTCLLAAERLDPDQEVEVPEEATQVIPTKMYLKTGEKLTVRDLLHGALLESANDAAMALGIATAGSVKAFAKLMNERAATIGCTNTHFENPSGLAAENHHASAMDVALLSEEAFKNPTIRKICGTLEYTVPKTNKAEARELKNGNLFLNGGEAEIPTGKVKVKKYDGVFGGKTGTTENQVATMTVGLDDDGLEIYAVVLGSTMQRRYSDIRKMLDYAKENVSKYVVFEQGATFDEKGKVLGGATNRVTGEAAQAGYINLPEGVSASLATTKVIYSEELNAPVKKGEKVGVVEIYLSDEKVREIDLLASEAIEEGWVLSRFGITNMQTIIICTVIALLLIFLIAILTLRAVNKRKRKKRRQRRAMELARQQLEREESARQRDWPY